MAGWVCAGYSLLAVRCLLFRFWFSGRCFGAFEMLACLLIHLWVAVLLVWGLV
ncbi:hypothetical protein GGS21DRAFT_518058 [Xylaria nigripes]|nr:hypothetical protein GGS21DRAFT_518058 [Xylaria nigripes]